MWDFSVGKVSNFIWEETFWEEVFWVISERFRKYGLIKASSQLPLLAIIIFVIIDINISIKIIALLSCQIYISLVDLD